MLTSDYRATAVRTGNAGRALLVVACSMAAGCATSQGTKRAGAEAYARRGDEIMVCGRMFHTGGAPVVLWTDPGGYDAYRVEKRFGPIEQAGWEAISKAGASAAATSGAARSGPDTPNRYGVRFAGTLDAGEREKVRGGGWELAQLQSRVDQFVLHYDVCGTSRQCFRVLHDVRGLSVHFMLDLDGTIYQTLDLKERAWHATTSNDRSIGIEIANIGAYSAKADGSLPETLGQWYGRDGQGWRVTLPSWMGDGGLKPGFVARPSRGPVVGRVQGKNYEMFDLTEAQYDSLVKLTATLCEVFPKITCDYPRDSGGGLETRKLADEALANYHGILGHFHIQENKVDPGPALQWDRLIEGARRRMR